MGWLNVLLNPSPFGTSCRRSGTWRRRSSPTPMRRRAGHVAQVRCWTYQAPDDQAVVSTRCGGILRRGHRENPTGSEQR